MLKWFLKSSTELNFVEKNNQMILLLLLEILLFYSSLNSGHLIINTFQTYTWVTLAQTSYKIYSVNYTMINKNIKLHLKGSILNCL